MSISNKEVEQYEKTSEPFKEDFVKKEIVHSTLGQEISYFYGLPKEQVMHSIPEDLHYLVKLSEELPFWFRTTSSGRVINDEFITFCNNGCSMTNKWRFMNFDEFLNLCYIPELMYAHQGEISYNEYRTKARFLL